jgi:hypothetical protein
MAMSERDVGTITTCSVVAIRSFCVCQKRRNKLYKHPRKLCLWPLGGLKNRKREFFIEMRYSSGRYFESKL